MLVYVCFCVAHSYQYIADSFVSSIHRCEGLFESRSLNSRSPVTVALTEIEQFEGILLLATNRPFDLDAAMYRRINLSIEFPSPDPHLRHLIWKRHIPPRLPVEEGLDWQAVAMDFELTGGFIKNAMLQALSFAVARMARQARGGGRSSGVGRGEGEGVGGRGRKEGASGESGIGGRRWAWGDGRANTRAYVCGTEVYGEGWRGERRRLETGICTHVATMLKRGACLPGHTCRERRVKKRRGRRSAHQLLTSSSIEPVTISFVLVHAMPQMESLWASFSCLVASIAKSLCSCALCLRSSKKGFAKLISHLARKVKEVKRQGEVTATQGGGMLSGREDPSNPEIGHFGPFSP